MTRSYAPISRLHLASKYTYRLYVTSTDTGFSSRENSYDTRSNVSETQNIDTPLEQICDFFQKFPITHFICILRDMITQSRLIIENIRKIITTLILEKL